MFPADTKILIIDDFASMRKILRKTLAELGFLNVVEAADGAFAVPLLRQSNDKNEPFHLIISDSNMPQISGLDLLKICKADPLLKSIPFVLVTAESDEKVIRQAAKNGVSDYVVKPFTSAVLKSKLEKIHARFSAKKAAA